MLPSTNPRSALARRAREPTAAVASRPSPHSSHAEAHHKAGPGRGDGPRHLDGCLACDGSWGAPAHAGAAGTSVVPHSLWRLPPGATYSRCTQFPNLPRRRESAAGGHLQSQGRAEGQGLPLPGWMNRWHMTHADTISRPAALLHHHQPPLLHTQQPCPIKTRHRAVACAAVRGKMAAASQAVLHPSTVLAAPQLPRCLSSLGWCALTGHNAVCSLVGNCCFRGGVLLLASYVTAACDSGFQRGLQWLLNTGTQTMGHKRLHTERRSLVNPLRQQHTAQQHGKLDALAGNNAAHTTRHCNRRQLAHAYLAATQLKPHRLQPASCLAPTQSSWQE